MVSGGESPGGPSQRTGGERALGDAVFRGLATCVAFGILGLLGLIVVVLASGSTLSFQAFGPAFLWTNVWSVSPPYAFGDLPYVYGTLVTSALAMALGVPVSLGIAIFLSELSPGWLRTPLGTLVEMLAAVPSVVYGLWGFLVLAPLMRDSVEPALSQYLGWTPLFSGTFYGLDLLTAGVILAVMIIPTVSAISREAMSAVPQSQREAVLALGATRWETTRVGVLTYASSGLFGAMILGLGRALGETMAVTMTIGNENIIAPSLFGHGQTIASAIATQFTDATFPLYRSALIELGLVLLLVSLAVNVVARLLVGKAGTAPEGRA